MFSRAMMMVCSLLIILHAPAMLAQTGDGAELVSGTWTGELVPGDRDPVSVTFQLKSDGKAVTGTFTGLPNPGDVKEGTFDAKTGVLQLRLGKRDDPAVLLVLDGVLANKIASGRFSGEANGTFKLEKK